MQQETRYFRPTREAPLRVLFIGNSATYKNTLPETLCALANEAGYPMVVSSVTPGGYTLTQHADAATEHGRRVLNAIAEGHDAVFLQDNGNCVSSPEMSEAARVAFSTLCAAIRRAGSQPMAYVRPPYATEKFGYDVVGQCRALDELFGDLCHVHDAIPAYVNRAFAHAYLTLPYDLWCHDRGHTSLHGAYLAICVFFATLFGVSSTKLGTLSLPAEEARDLQNVADRVALEGLIPWETL